ncbi:Uncharacterized protein APZ42_027983, partial [Daphnia magna]
NRLLTWHRRGRILHPTAITGSDLCWSCCLGNGPLRQLLYFVIIKIDPSTNPISHQNTNNNTKKNNK